MFQAPLHEQTHNDEFVYVCLSVCPSACFTYNLYSHLHLRYGTV